MAQICTLPLPGNVRELENVLHRAMALSDNAVLELDTHAVGTQPQPLRDDTETTIPAELIASFAAPTSVVISAADPIPSDLQVHLDRIERDILVRTLRETRFNRTSAAHRLGISLRQIRYRMARLQIDAPNASDDPTDA